ncbi:MAG: hypothetical protein R3C19_25635 [Planctomycetaceae bacterium]
MSKTEEWSAAVHYLPQSNPLPPSSATEAWQKLNPGEPVPMMFQLRLLDGRIISFAYADLREIRTRDAGFIELGLYGMDRYRVGITGRNLTELTTLLSLGRIRRLEESDPRDLTRSENSPTIDSITIETLPPPA